MGDDTDYQFDYFIIGGGSGGLASGIQAAKHGAKVGLCDFVTPTPSGTTWGLGGTCVNVGCIPKKLMHQAALLGQCMKDAPHFGWKLSEYVAAHIEHDWTKMVTNINEYIISLNVSYRFALKEEGIVYFNALAQFVDDHTVQLMKNGEEVAKITSKYFLIATGGRPKYLDDVPGANPGEHCITSDDLFSLPYHPGKVVIVGASYIALETAGFLSGLGMDVTVLVRSQLLRGFDQQMAGKIGHVLENHGVKILKNTVPTKVELLSKNFGLWCCRRKPKKTLLVHGQNTHTEKPFKERCNTVILAVGRSPCVTSLHLENCGIKVNPSSGRIIVDDKDQTSVPHCFAVGDVAEGRPELTPVAVQAGKLLANRLFDKSTELTMYERVPTTVFTPLEYGCVGLSEERAMEIYGAKDIEVFHVSSPPLEFALPNRDKTSCYSKLICVKSLNLQVVGFHYLGPNAGDITQGYAVAVKMNAKKSDFDGTIGIHPTCAEQFTTMTVTKTSGSNWMQGVGSARGC